MRKLAQSGEYAHSMHCISDLCHDSVVVLFQALAEMGRKPSKEELHDLFEMFDGDGNGEKRIRKN